MSTRECVKVADLRKIYGSEITLQKWLLDSNNMYVGRQGRISIGKSIFTYKCSKWANPFKLEDHTLEESLALYREYITDKIKTNPMYYNVNELKNKNLGCWCQMTSECHVDVLLSIVNERIVNE